MELTKLTVTSLEDSSTENLAKLLQSIGFKVDSVVGKTISGSIAPNKVSLLKGIVGVESVSLVLDTPETTPATNEPLMKELVNIEKTVTKELEVLKKEEVAHETGPNPTTPPVTAPPANPPVPSV